MKRERDFRIINRIKLTDVYDRIKEGQIRELNLVIKGDVDGSVEALAADNNGDVYVGGTFEEVGTTPTLAAPNIAKWNGSSWFGLGSGVDDWVYALAKAPGGDLLAGGDFLHAGGNPANHVAVLRTTGQWESLGSGTDQPVVSVAIGSVVVGGEFTIAGGKPSHAFASWDGEILGTELFSFTASRGADGIIYFEWEIQNEGALQEFVIEQRRSHETEWETGKVVPPKTSSSGMERYSASIEPDEPGAYIFRLKITDRDGSSFYSDDVEISILPAERFVLTGPYPNPSASPVRMMEINLPVSQQVDIRLYDILGREVSQVFSGTIPAVESVELEIDTQWMAPGSYIIRVVGERFVAEEKVVVIR